MRCRLIIDECAKKCGVAEYKRQVLLRSLVLASSGVFEPVVYVVVVKCSVCVPDDGVMLHRNMSGVL